MQVPFLDLTVMLTQKSKRLEKDPFRALGSLLFLLSSPAPAPPRPAPPTPRATLCQRTVRDGLLGTRHCAGEPTSLAPLCRQEN